MPRLSDYANLTRQLARLRFCKLASCNRSYVAEAGNQKYCSARCRQKAYRRRQQIQAKKCYGCGREYLATPDGRHRRSYYHSNACKQRTYRRRRANRPSLADQVNQVVKTPTWYGIRQTTQPPGSTDVPD
jgi:hypothetical protein